MRKKKKKIWDRNDRKLAADVCVDYLAAIPHLPAERRPVNL
jgi:hypothetical protein